MPSLQRDALQVEISTAGYYELVARARELGLPDTGGVDELRASLYKYYGLEAPPAPGKGRIVTIEKAGQASFAKVEEGEGGIVRASGGVILTLVETNGDTHRIRADSIVFDRERSTLTARGKVRYERKSGSTTDIFAGEALSANLDDWSGVFIDGKMRKAGGIASSGERGLMISADTILSRSTDMMVLENGVISSSDADDPHYAIRAKHVWILGDKELAFSNAVFSLGNVPVLWLPFFYYPGDEIVFHPVIGYRNREGTYVQTTVYLIGQKPPSTDTTSVLSMTTTGPAQATQLKGLFLRNVPGPPPKDVGSLKTIFDLYSNLGGFAGLQGSFPKLSFLGKTDLFTGIGLSRSLFLESSGAYSPYDAASNYSSVWNSSDFLNLDLPFRYAFDFSTAMQLGGFTATLALPIYSDPYIDYDFRYRSEDMNWFKLLSSTTDDPTLAPPILSQLYPKLDASLTLTPKSLDPWLQSVNIAHFGTWMTLLTKTDTTLYADNPTNQSTLAPVDPRYQFFYPSVFRPIDTTATFHGSFLGGQTAATPSASDKSTASAAAIELRDPWVEAPDDQTQTSNPASTGDASATTAQEESAAPAAANSPAAPEEAAAPANASATTFRLLGSAPSTTETKPSSWAGTATWTLTPSMYYEDHFRSDWINSDNTSDYWQNPSQIAFNDLLYGLLSYNVASSIDTTAAYGDYLSSSLSLTYADQAQKRPVDTADPTTAASYDLADNLYTSRSVGGIAKMGFKPFADSWLWSPTSLNWEMDSTIYGMKYDTTLATPDFTENWLSWDPSSITTHNLTLDLAARPGGLTQSLALVASLPPTLESYSAQLGLSAGFSTFNVQSRMYRSAVGADFSFDPITAALTVGTAPGPALTDNAVYDATGVGWVSNTAGLSWGPVSASLTQAQTTSYTPELGTGWVPVGTQTFFAPTALAISIAPQLKSATDVTMVTSSVSPLWTLAPSLSLTQSLVRFSESTLTFSLSASIKIGSELNVTFASVSQNSQAWRYYAGLFDSQLSQAGLSSATYQINPITDIWQSLSIWDPNSLANTLFKLKSLSVTLARDLEDWTLSATVSTTPYYTGTTYTLDTKISIILAWKDMSAIQSTINYDSNPVAPATSITY